MLCLVLTLSLAACGGGSDPAPAAPATEAPATETPAPATEAPDNSTTGTASSSDEEYYDQDITITNNTGVAILELYIAPSDEDSWGDDLMGSEVFEANETLEFTTELIATDGYTWDIFIIDEDGDEVTFEGVDFSSTTAISLGWGADGQTPTVLSGELEDFLSDDEEEEYFSQDLSFRNDTGITIMELYISPSEENHWGEDLMGDDVFSEGEVLDFTTDLVGTADTTWDVKIIDEDGDEVVFTGINFSIATSVSLNWGADGQTPTAESFA